MAVSSADEIGRTVGVRPIRIVTGTTATDELGRVVDTTPIRYVADPVTTDSLGRLVSAVPVELVSGLITTDLSGRTVPVRPCRVVSGLTTLDSSGRTVEAIPVRIDPIAVLGASLLAFWDAERSSTLTLSGSSVTTWTDRKAGYAPTQAVGGSKPAYSATSFNGRPGLTFDGADDYLELGSVPFPAGASPSEIWYLGSQDSLPADTNPRAMFDYGDGANARRQLRRTVNAGSNRPQLVIGTGAGIFGVENTGDFSGKHVIRAIAGATQSSVVFDGGTPATSTVTPATGTNRTRIGANAASSAGLYFQGVISAILVTAPLTTDQAAQLTQYLKTRGGIA